MPPSTTPGAIPAPPFKFPPGYAFEMQRDILGLADRLSSRYGGLVRIPVPGTKIFLATDADLIHFVLVESERSFTKGPQNKHFVPLLGRGLVLSTGAHWKQQRRMMNPFFSSAAINGFSGHLFASIDDVLTPWKNLIGSEIDVYAEMRKLTLQIILRSLFSGQGLEYCERLFQSFNLLSEFCIRRFFSVMPLPLSLAYILRPAAKRAYNDLQSMLESLIESRRNENNSSSRTDLLSMLMEARDEETGRPMSNQEIRDELMTIFFAGFDTTSVGLSMSLHLLSQNPEWRDSLESEADQKVSGLIPTLEETRGFDRITKAFMESIRLYPPAYMINRCPIEDVQYADYTLPAGSVVLISIWGVQRSPHYWSDPLRFNPDRFSEESKHHRHRFAYIPFGGGPRVCLGKNLALLEGSMILGAILKSFRLTHRRDHVLHIKTGSTLTVANGMPMRLEARY